MNANELADELETFDDHIFEHYGDETQAINMKAAKMLRFQQEELNALREQVQYLQTQVYGGTTK